MSKSDIRISYDWEDICKLAEVLGIEPNIDETTGPGLIEAARNMRSTLAGQLVEMDRAQDAGKQANLVFGNHQVVRIIQQYETNPVPRNMLEEDQARVRMHMMRSFAEQLDVHKLWHTSIKPRKSTDKADQRAGGFLHQYEVWVVKP